MLVIPPVDARLKGVNITRRNAGCCGRGGSILVYRLPFPLDTDAVPFITKMRPLALNFEKTKLLKIETREYIISGIKKIKEIRFTYRNDNAKLALAMFEDILFQLASRK